MNLPAIKEKVLGNLKGNLRFDDGNVNDNAANQ